MRVPQVVPCPYPAELPFPDFSGSTAVTIRYAVTDAVTDADREWVRRKSEKVYRNGAFFGGPPLLRRAFRHYGRGNYVRAVGYGIPGVILPLFSLALPLAAFLGTLNDSRNPIRSMAAAWERRLCAAIDKHTKSNDWGNDVKSLKLERDTVKWLKEVLRRQPERLAYSDMIWIFIHYWNREIRDREKASGRIKTL